MPTYTFTDAEMEAIKFCIVFSLANRGEDSDEDQMFNKARDAMKRVLSDLEYHDSYEGA